MTRLVYERNFPLDREGGPPARDHITRLHYPALVSDGVSQSMERGELSDGFDELSGPPATRASGAGTMDVTTVSGTRSPRRRRWVAWGGLPLILAAGLGWFARTAEPGRAPRLRAGGGHQGGRRAGVLDRRPDAGVRLARHRRPLGPRRRARAAGHSPCHRLGEGDFLARLHARRREPDRRIVGRDGRATPAGLRLEGLGRRHRPRAPRR